MKHFHMLRLVGIHTLCALVKYCIVHSTGVGIHGEALVCFDTLFYDCNKGLSVAALISEPQHEIGHSQY